MPFDMLPQTTDAPALPFWHIMPTDSPEKRALKFAYAKIAHKRNWCRSETACDERGRHVGANNPSAIRFCAYGAMVRAQYDLELPAGTAFQAVKSGGLTMGRVTFFNDWLGRRAVMWILKNAILRV